MTRDPARTRANDAARGTVRRHFRFLPEDADRIERLAEALTAREGREVPQGEAVALAVRETLERIEEKR